MLLSREGLKGGGSEARLDEGAVEGALSSSEDCFSMRKGPSSSPAPLFSSQPPCTRRQPQALLLFRK
jgi:hypothetical protein